MPQTKTQPILIVEDSDEDFETVRWAFAKIGFEHPVVRCVTGDDALDYLQQCGKNMVNATRPLLVLLDLNLPGTDGREVLAEVKATPSLRSIPVIILTTSSNPRDVNESYAAGANAYMLKPVNLEKLVADLKAFCDYWLGAVLLCNAPEQP